MDLNSQWLVIVVEVFVGIGVLCGIFAKLDSINTGLKVLYREVAKGKVEHGEVRQ